MAMNNSEVVPSFSAMIYFFYINNTQFFVVAAANIELQWCFAFGWTVVVRCVKYGVLYAWQTSITNCICNFLVLRIATLVIMWTCGVMFNSFQIIGNIYLLEIYISLQLFIESETDTFCHPNETVW